MSTTFKTVSADKAREFGLEPDPKRIHVVETSAPAIEFSSNAIERASAFESAREAQVAAEARAAALRADAEKADADAARAAARAADVVRQEGVATRVAGIQAGLGSAVAASAGALALQGALGLRRGVAPGLVVGGLGIAIGYGMAKRHPVPAAAIIAAFLALGAGLAMEDR